jgi:D-sedoheptulose 7-phosphate isomerase
MDWTQYIDHLAACLAALEVSDHLGEAMDHKDAFARLCQRTTEVRAAGATVFCVGNGASASIASHVAADMNKNGNVRTEVFTDLAIITAVANDIGFDQVYAEPLCRKMNSVDVLLAISSSGNSPNILNAVATARKLGGFVITLSAMRPDNALRASGDLNFYVPADTYGMAESAHATLLHHWIDRIVAAQ